MEVGAILFHASTPATGGRWFCACRLGATAFPTHLACHPPPPPFAHAPVACPTLLPPGHPLHAPPTSFPPQPLLACEPQGTTFPVAMVIHCHPNRLSPHGGAGRSGTLLLEYRWEKCFGWRSHGYGREASGHTCLPPALAVTISTCCCLPTWEDRSRCLLPLPTPPTLPSAGLSPWHYTSGGQALYKQSPADAG